MYVCDVCKYTRRSNSRCKVRSLVELTELIQFIPRGRRTLIVNGGSQWWELTRLTGWTGRRGRVGMRHGRWDRPSGYGMCHLPCRETSPGIHPFLVGLQFGLVSFLVLTSHELVRVLLGGVHQLPVLGKPLCQLADAKLGVLGLDVRPVL